MYLEYDPEHNLYRSRFDGKLTAIHGVISFKSLKEARRHLKQVGLAIGDRISSHSWKIIRNGEF